LVATIGSIPIISKVFFSKNDFEKYHDKPIMGSGPYKIKEYDFGKYIIYERVKNYWGKDLPVNKGQYNFDEIQYDCYQDMDVAVQALLNEEYDFRQENVARIWATAYNADLFNKGLMIKEVLPSKQPANLQATFFNLRKPVLNDVNLRRAINLAYDFDWINKYLFYGSYERLESYFHNTEFAASGIPVGRELEILSEFKDQIPIEIFDEIYITPTTGAERKNNRENLKQAKQILLNAGYKIINNKMISPITNKPIELEIIYVYQGFERIFHVLKDNLARIGITLNLRFIDKAQYEQRQQKFDYDLINAAFIPSIIPGPVQEMIWHSKSDIVGGYNLAGVHNVVVDNLIQRIKKANDKNEMIALCKALDRILLWNYYTIPQHYSAGFRIVYWNKFERPQIKPSYNIGENTWWMKGS
jgi:microcin C transport system substrate-binding protein